MGSFLEGSHAILVVWTHLCSKGQDIEQTTGTPKRASQRNKTFYKSNPTAKCNVSIYLCDDVKWWVVSYSLGTVDGQTHAPQTGF